MRRFTPTPTPCGGVFEEKTWKECMALWARPKPVARAFLQSKFRSDPFNRNSPDIQRGSFQVLTRRFIL